MNGSNISRRQPIGVEVVDHNRSTKVHARVWAPDRRAVDFVVDEGEATPLERDDAGYFAGFVSAAAGSRYKFRLDGGDLYPDPASRFQPSGPHGWSEVVDASAFEWTDREWTGASIDGQVIYELHIGTFTRAGTFRAAIERLPDLVDLGVTVLEIMPIAEFAGQFGWGYDGVNLFAPSHLYGTPNDLRELIDAAHRLELGVLLDVVYNHFGPDGNYAAQFARAYASGKRTEWGDALNFDGPDSAPVREFFLANARYWIDEFHFDGLRLDATQQIFDTSPLHIVAEVASTVRDAAGGRRTIVLAENEPQQADLVRPRDAGGMELDAVWNDDFHHSVRVASSGRNEAYFSGYRGDPQELISAAKYGFLYQGQWYEWQKQRRGTPALDIPPQRFVTFIQNHDQVANSAAGRRLHQETSAAKCRALGALLLLAPQTPMLFQGQEFAASAPFLYFADHKPELARLVSKGRAEFMSQFPSIAAREESARIDDPSDPWTFVRCKLDWSERKRNNHTLDMYRDLLKLRREDPVLRAPRLRGVDGAVLSPHAFLIRYFAADGGDRVLVVNLGCRIHADPLAEPLAAPPTRAGWRTAFSSESPRYGGWGVPLLDTPDDGWWIPGESATLLVPADDATSSR